MEKVLVEQLVEILNQENEIYDTLSKISNNKKDLIVGGKVQELDTIVKLEQALVVRISKLEGEREKVVGELCALLGQKPEDVTVSGLSEKLGEKDSAQLKACQEKMLTKIFALKNANDLNSRLIKNSLEYIDFSINMMTSIGSVSNNYGSSGYSGDTKKRNLFDMKL